MARYKTAQPKHSLRKIAVVVATAVSGMSVYAQAAVEPKEDTITVTAAPAPQESAWGPAATIAARQSATGTKTDTQYGMLLQLKGHVRPAKVCGYMTGIQSRNAIL